MKQSAIAHKTKSLKLAGMVVWLWYEPVSTWSLYWFHYHCY